MNAEDRHTCPSCGNELSGAMEFCPVCMLRKGLAGGISPVKLALEIATQAAAGLAAVHRQRLVHRDRKPSNIMVNLEEGGAVTAKIIDLGLAKPAPDAPAEAAISTPGAFAGTPASLVRSSSPASAWTSARTSTRWAWCSGRW